MTMPDNMFSKSFAHHLMLGVDADCVTYRDYVPWADRVVMKHDKPPLWICELSTARYKPDALRIIGGYVFSEPFEDLTNTDVLYLGFLWIRYSRRELSWASFLSKSGDYADGSGVWECEAFYVDLNQYEEAGFPLDLEKHQSSSWMDLLRDEINEAERFYADLKRAD